MRKGHLLALFCVCVWGATFISTKVLFADFSPVEVMFYRMIIGFAALFVSRPKRLKFGGWSRELLLIGAGLSGVTLYFLFENVALTTSFAGNVSVIVSSAPMFTAIAARLFLGEKVLSPRFFVGFGLAMAGISVIYLNGSLFIGLSPLGDLLALLSAIMWGIYSVIIKILISSGMDQILMTRRIFLYGLLTMIPTMIYDGFSAGLDRFLSPFNTLNMLFLGIVASSLCFVSWGKAIEKLGPVKSGVYIYLIPVVTLIFSAIVLKEPITLISLLGIALTTTGLLVSEGRKIKIPRLGKSEK